MHKKAISILMFSLFFFYLSPSFAADNLEKIKAAAEQGDTKAQLLLAIRFAKGTPQNPGEALKWLTKAAEGGHVDAQLSLGAAYLYGSGVSKNNIKAYTFIGLAAAKNSPEARKILLQLKSVMSAAQITEAQKAIDRLSKNIGKNQK